MSELKCIQCQNTTFHKVELVKLDTRRTVEVKGVKKFVVGDDGLNPHSPSTLYVCVQCASQYKTLEDFEGDSLLKTEIIIVPSSISKIVKAVPSLTRRELKNLTGRGRVQVDHIVYLTDQWIQNNDWKPSVQETILEDLR